ncbi:MAG: peptidoglycan editing factor PgeF [Betaproteobacteria bacterium]|nr:peptidoglycan editing factor PgeF [Betaproteobacteria bacterium]
MTLADCVVPDWPAASRVKALFTTRQGGVSSGAWASLNLGKHVGDDADAVAENRRRFGVLLPREPQWISLVHGDRVLRWEDDQVDLQGDAVVTSLPERPCIVTAADCLPVFFCDRAATTVGVAHAGWRGLAADVLERTVEAMRVPPVQIQAWLGPAIGPTAFEVGDDVRNAFVAVDPRTAIAFAAAGAHRPGKYFADIYRLARQRLAQAGVTQVYGGGFCTVNEPARFFSHRRDRISGRMAAAIWLQP